MESILKVILKGFFEILTGFFTVPDAGVLGQRIKNENTYGTTLTTYDVFITVFLRRDAFMRFECTVKMGQVFIAQPFADILDWDHVRNVPTPSA